jgi:hypothetical protein
LNFSQGKSSEITHDRINLNKKGTNFLVKFDFRFTKFVSGDKNNINLMTIKCYDSNNSFVSLVYLKAGVINSTDNNTWISTGNIEFFVDSSVSYMTFTLGDLTNNCVTMIDYRDIYLMDASNGDSFRESGFTLDNIYSRNRNYETLIEDSTITLTNYQDGSTGNNTKFDGSFIIRNNDVSSTPLDAYGSTTVSRPRYSIVGGVLIIDVDYVRLTINGSTTYPILSIPPALTKRILRPRNYVITSDRHPYLFRGTRGYTMKGEIMFSDDRTTLNIWNADALSNAQIGFSAYWLLEE